MDAVPRILLEAAFGHDFSGLGSPLQLRPSGQLAGAAIPERALVHELHRVAVVERELDDLHGSEAVEELAAVSQESVHARISFRLALTVSPHSHRGSTAPVPARSRQQPQRQHDVPDEVRLPAGEPRRLADEGVLRPLRHPADALSRLHGEHLPLPLLK